MIPKEIFFRITLIFVLFLFCAGANSANAQVNPYANNAFEDNMKVVDSVLVLGQYKYIFAIYSGDINQDGNIDLSDFPLWDVDNSSFNFGYLATDLNGDGNVDLSDYPFWDANNTNFVYAHRP